MSILPSNASLNEIATVDSTDILTKLGASADLIARFKSVPGDPLLPFLIWEYGLGEIQQYLIDPRRVIAEGIQWQRLRGTPAAMHMAFGWIGQTLTIEEEQGAHWVTYQLGLPQIEHFTLEIVACGGQSPPAPISRRGFACNPAAGICRQILAEQIYIVKVDLLWRLSGCCGG
ncbi:MAG: phage tail protein [Desulfovibrio sp.]|jgi:P2-related tail formation protein|nr:phage tail protein [Desulfovibrio sp.]